MRTKRQNLQISPKEKPRRPVGTAAVATLMSGLPQSLLITFTNFSLTPLTNISFLLVSFDKDSFTATGLNIMLCYLLP